MLTLPVCKVKINGTKKLFRLVVSSLTDMDCTIWQVMSMNGVQTGTTKVTMPIHHIKTQKGLNQALKAGEYCEVDLGTTLRAIPYVVD